jgi:hypothetical protein
VEGKVTLAGLPAGKWKVQAWSSGRSKTRASRLPPVETVTVREDETASVTLRAPKGLTVSGLVVGDGDAPLSGVVVAAMPNHGQDERANLLVETGADGAFEFSGLPSGSVTLRAYDGAARASSAMVDVEAPRSDVRLRLKGRSEITGRLLGDGDVPLTSFSVEHQHFDAEDGRFHVPAPVGEHTLFFDAEGYAQLGITVVVKPGTTDVGEVHMNHGRTLEGLVVDAESGEPIAGALVDIGLANKDGTPPRNFVLSVDRGAATTDAAGHYRLERVDSRSTLLLATHADYASTSQPLGPGATHADLKLTRGGTIRVAVVDVSGKPVTDGFVSATTADGRMQMAPPMRGKGDQSLSGLDAAEWSVSVFHPKLVFHPVTVGVTAGATVNLTLKEASDGIDVTVTGADRTRLTLFAGAVTDPLTTAKGGAAFGRELLMSFDGHFAHVRPGTWTLMAIRAGSSGASEVLTVPLTVAAEALTLPLPSTGWKAVSPSP